MQITTVGLDLAKRVFQVMPLTRQGASSCAKRCGDHKFYRSLSSCHPV
jgi:hypothetical protein